MPAQPFFLDAAVKNFGPARAWQNDVKWTEPWGPATTARCFRLVEEWYAKGNAELVNVIASETIRRHNWRTVATVAAGGTSQPVHRLKVEDVEEVILDAKRLIEILP